MASGPTVVESEWPVVGAEFVAVVEPAEAVVGRRPPASMRSGRVWLARR